MSFDKWIDAVNAGVHTRLGKQVRTEELSWDSAMWVTSAGTAVASVANDESTAKLFFDGGERMSVDIRQPEASPELISELIVGRIIAT